MPLVAKKLDKSWSKDGQKMVKRWTKDGQKLVKLTPCDLFTAR